MPLCREDNTYNLARQPSHLTMKTLNVIGVILMFPTGCIKYTCREGNFERKGPRTITSVVQNVGGGPFLLLFIIKYQVGAIYMIKWRQFYVVLTTNAIFTEKCLKFTVIVPWLNIYRGVVTLLQCKKCKQMLSTFYFCPAQSFYNMHYFSFVLNLNKLISYKHVRTICPHYFSLHFCYAPCYILLCTYLYKHTLIDIHYPWR